MAVAYQTWADWYLKGPYSDCVEEVRMGGRDVPFQMTRLLQPRGRYPDPPVDSLVLGVCVRGRGGYELDVGAGRWRGTAGVGDMILVAPKTPTEFVQDGSLGLLCVAIPSETLGAIESQSGIVTWSDYGVLHSAPFRNTGLHQLAQSLWNEATVGTPQGALFADNALLALIHWLRALAEGGRIREGETRPDARIDKAVDLLGDRLGDDLSLAELAAAAGLSPFHFARAFKAATGETPHRYLMRRRVERAKELLGRTALPVTEIALACGFASSQHFATSFKRTVGTTPTDYRLRVRA